MAQEQIRLEGGPYDGALIRRGNGYPPVIVKPPVTPGGVHVIYELTSVHTDSGAAQLAYTWRS